jgi:hypothetical protein
MGRMRWLQKSHLSVTRLVFQAFIAGSILHTAGQKKMNSAYEDAYSRAHCGVVLGGSLAQRVAVNLVNVNERRVYCFTTFFFKSDDRPALPLNS